MRRINHGRPVTSFTFSPDGTRALTNGDDEFAQVWEARTWRPLTQIRLPESKGTNGGRFSPDNSLIALWGDWSKDNNLAWWEVETGRLVGESSISNYWSDQPFDWRPDGQQLLLFSKRDEFTLWNASSKQMMGLQEAFGSEAIIDAVYAPDGRTLLTATEGEVRIWDSCDREQSSMWPAPEQDDINTDIPLYIQRRRNWYQGFRAARPHLERFLPPGTNFSEAALSPDQSRVVTCHDRSDGNIPGESVHLWDARTKQQVGKPLESMGLLTYMAFSPDSRRLVATSRDNTARLVNAKTGEPVGRPLKHDGSVLHATFSPDGELVVTCGMDSMARLWRTQTGEPVGEKLYHSDYVNRAAFSPNGKIVATGSKDGTVRLWDVNRGAPLGVLDLKKSSCVDLAFDP